MIVDTKEVVITITYMINVRMSTLTASYGKCAVFILIFISKSQPVKPVSDRLLCIGTELLCCLPLDSHTVKHLCIWQIASNRRVCSRFIAALMCIERDNNLIGKVIAVHKGIDRHRHIAPPYRVAEENNVILLHIIDSSAQFGTCLSHRSRHHSPQDRA